MLFSSLFFIYRFLPGALLVYYLAGKRLRPYVLLMLNLFFCFWGGPSYALVLVASIIINYLGGVVTDYFPGKPKRKLVFLSFIALNLSLLIIFKYAGFFVWNLNFMTGLLGAPPLVIPRIIMPLGISFYTFKGISYLISVYRKEVPGQQNLVSVAVYISFFPQLLAGPIARYRDYYPQLLHRDHSVEKFREGIQRFLTGLFKKVLIATPLATLVGQLDEIPYVYMNAPLAWLGIAFYTLQIYYDFSGYTDMAIGVGKMFGFTTAENFDHPFTSRSFQEFWRRWHITLSTWFRDYLFLPLAFYFSRRLPHERYLGVRADRVIYLIATTVTFLLCGLWHGAAWTFIAWGSIHGVMLIAEKFGLSKILKRAPRFISHFYLIFFLLVSFVFFRADSLSGAADYLRLMAGVGPGSFSPVQLLEYANPGTLALLTMAIAGCTPVFRKILAAIHVKAGAVSPRWQSVFLHSLNFGFILGMVAILALSTSFLTGQAIRSFIYFKF